MFREIFSPRFSSFCTNAEYQQDQTSCQVYAAARIPALQRPCRACCRFELSAFVITTTELSHPRSMWANNHHHISKLSGAPVDIDGSGSVPGHELKQKFIYPARWHSREIGDFPAGTVLHSQPAFSLIHCAAAKLTARRRRRQQSSISAATNIRLVQLVVGAFARI